MDLVDPFDYYDKHGVWPTYKKNNVVKMEDKIVVRQNQSARSPRTNTKSPRTPANSARTPVKAVRTPRGRTAPSITRVSSADMREAMNAPLSDMPPAVSTLTRMSSPSRSRPSGSSSSRAASPRSPRAASPRSPRAASPRSPMVRPGRVASPTGRELKPPRGTEGRWKDERPKTEAERKAMNPNCFLGTRKDGTPGYPICARGTDRISCSGVVGAKRRAAQQGDLDVLAKAEELNQRYKCTKKTRMEQERAAGNVRRR